MLRTTLYTVFVKTRKYTCVRTYRYDVLSVRPIDDAITLITVHYMKCTPFYNILQHITLNRYDVCCVISTRLEICLREWSIFLILSYVNDSLSL